MRTFTLELEGGGRVVGDHLPGSAPHYLFLHGLGSVRAGEKSASLVAHAVAHGRACTRFDFRGHGDSSGTIGEITIGELIADTLLVLDQHGPAVIVGSSLGGLVGAFAAAARPDRVRGLALLAPALGFLRGLGDRLDLGGGAAAGEGRSFPLSQRVVEDARRLDERGLPGRLTMPTLVVHGTADAVVGPDGSERFFAAIPHPHKALWVVPDGDHRLNTVAGEIWRRLDELLLAPRR